MFALVSLHLVFITSISQSVYHSSSSAIESHLFELETFHDAPVAGFANHQIHNGANCDDLRVESTLAVTQSFHIGEDLVDIAKEADHPLLDYSGQQKGQSFAKMVEKTWAQMSGSSVWLEKHQVYLTASRVIFFTKGVKKWPVISFLRAQLHDSRWRPLPNHNITWRGEQITFPRIMEIDIPYVLGGAFYGPEDPRIIMEQGVEDAEPVILFNMVANLTSTKRSMHAFHPFSNFTTRFQIEDFVALDAEKNWAPFFIPRSMGEGSKFPSQHIHFVYNLSPLRILKCHLNNGFCKSVYEQPRPEAYISEHKHNETGGVMRGGTNFEPLPATLQTRPGLMTWVSLTRTHTVQGCGDEAFYRPELMLLTSNGTTFYLDYASEAITVFDKFFLTSAQLGDPCRKGRIFMANSIARVYDDRYGRNKDVMEVSWSVDDDTVQVAKVRGVQALIAGLPQWNPSFNLITGESWRKEVPQWASNVTSDVLDCSVRSASDYALSVEPLEMKASYKDDIKKSEKGKH